MIFFLTLVLSFIILGVLLGAFKASTYLSEPNRQGDRELKSVGVIKGIAVLLLAFAAAFINPISIERIDVGHVGLKVNLTGDDRGVSKTQYVTGWVFYNSWFTRVIEYPTTQQHIDHILTTRRHNHQSTNLTVSCSNKLVTRSNSEYL